MDCTPPPVAVVEAQLIVTGDSIATGIGHQGRRGTEFTEAQWGRSPYQQLQFMLRRGSWYYANRDVVLSTGILNGEDWSSVEEQFKFLQESKPSRVRIVGTPFESYNDRLKCLAYQYGFEFLGYYEPGPDGIHPSSYGGFLSQ